jgi:hypothetical protein
VNHAKTIVRNRRIFPISGMAALVAIIVGCPGVESHKSDPHHSQGGGFVYLSSFR